VIIIAAMGSNRVIGSGRGMPWNVPEEYAQFLEFVRGQTVIMGRASWEIFGPDLTSAHNVVVSRNAGALDRATVVNGIETAVETGRGFGKTVFCAGGASIYRQCLPLADRMTLSIIKGEFDGDAFFPEFAEVEWEVAERRDHPQFELVDYRRR